jgi:rhodanese-related sulfurtransferase
MKALIHTAELRKQLESTDPPIVVDVRLEDDFKAAHIPGAINNCVYEVVFGERLTKSVPERTRLIAVYGANSESYEARLAAEKLSRSGYTNVYEYRDGLAAWQAAGAPVALGEPLPAEPTISDGTHPIDPSESSIEWRRAQPPQKTSRADRITVWPVGICPWRTHERTRCHRFEQHRVF